MTDPVVITPPPMAAPVQPAISWGAIWAGAVVAVAASLVLTLAAAGLGYNTGFPGLASRSSLRAFSPEVGAAAIAIQVLAAALGGYVAGRTRTIWLELHDHESHFRDTAHGLIVWAVASVGGVLLASAILAPYADALAAAAPAVAATPPTAPELERAANIAAQASLFLAIGMLLSAFVAAVAARIGGMRHEHMHSRGRA
jgi:hypothetical protein